MATTRAAEVTVRRLTAPGRGGIAVVEVAGPGARALLERHCWRGASKTGAVRRVELRGPDGVVDQCLLVRPEPIAERFELHLHGAPAVVEATLASLVAAGARRGTDDPPRALAEDARRRLHEALSVPALALALEQERAGLWALLGRFRGLVAAAASKPADLAELEPALERARAGAARSIAHFVPFKVALVGAKNAGKSSLLNTLVGQRRVLTGPQPGLTRDPVRTTLAMDGYPIEWLDLPGLGELAETLDGVALARARALVDGCDLVLQVVDRGRGLAADTAAWLGESPMPSAWIMTQCDRAPRPGVEYPAGAPLAVVRGDRPEAGGCVRALVARALRRWRGLPAAGAVGFATCTSPWQHEVATGVLGMVRKGNRAGALELLERVL